MDCKLIYFKLQFKNRQLHLLATAFACLSFHWLQFTSPSDMRDTARSGITKFMIIFIFMIMLTNLNSIEAQNCNNYEKKCDLADNSFTASSMSRGIKMAKGQVFSVICLFYAGKENYISFCGENDLGKFQIKILDYITKNVIYNNTDDNLKQNLIINVDVTAIIIIQLSAPSAIFHGTENKCAGLLIAYKDLKNGQ
ncbi:MAG: hypothetical protein A2309_00305 [Bacteroidetes bacterium RIFOXYB2_FULL_35_7]|nr:MAG: hypothetical protein A2X01_02250 [Bacteroidetes bacterium GWF2_35_48]OFY95220.1 MAG: hypothetical protein A2309_00305 [Bacteroidetes bacterium RIFOXYB2_FULL_35_7]HBX51590.1 hypothetical protein [Bacteroidales bacterium]